MDEKVIPITFNIWATDEAEVAGLKQEICAFIDYHGQQGRKVSARKLTEALRNWQRNPIVRQSIINHFKLNSV